MMRAARGLVLAAALAAGVASAQYRWIGPDGVVGYGDLPPAGARNIQVFKAGAAPAAENAPLPFELGQAVERFPVTLYTAANCGAPCESGRAWLRTRGVPHAERIVETEADVAAFRSATRSESLPTLVVGREVAASFAPGAWARLLDASGYPSTSQLPPGYRATPAEPMNTPRDAASRSQGNSR